MKWIGVGCLLTLCATGIGCAPIAYPLGLKACSPVYGNWCGENYPIDSSNGATPVDRWDEACETHDHCYEEADGNERKKLACDRRLLSEMRSISRTQPVPVEMQNAFSWFNKGNTGMIFVWGVPKDWIWSLTADCAGGDGKPAQFCRYPGGYCEMARDSEPGTPCRCGYAPGIVEESR